MSRFTRLSWWKSRLIELAVAGMISVAVVQIGQVISWQQKEYVPPESWMRVNEVYVPEFCYNQRPEIIYDRSIFDSFMGAWIVEVQRKNNDGLWSLHFAGSGVSQYEPEDVISGNKVGWEWFIGQDRAMPPGTYRLKLTYLMTKPDWPQKRLFATSNEFTVVPGC